MPGTTAGGRGSIPGDPGRPGDRARPGTPRGRMDAGAPPARRRRVHARPRRKPPAPPWSGSSRSTRRRGSTPSSSRPPSAGSSRRPAVRVASRPRFRLRRDDARRHGPGLRAGAPARRRCRWSSGCPAGTLPRGRGGRNGDGAHHHRRARARRVGGRGRRGSPRPRATSPRRPCLRRSASIALEPPGTWMRPTAWTATGLAVAAAGIATWQGIAAAGSYGPTRAGMLLPDGFAAGPASIRPPTPPRPTPSQAQRRNAWIAAGSALVLGAGPRCSGSSRPSSAVEPAPGGLAVRF